MRKHLVEKILAGPKVRLTDLKVDDCLQGFEGWVCVPDNAMRVVRQDETGLYIDCDRGPHYLMSQVGEDGFLLGMVRA